MAGQEYHLIIAPGDDLHARVVAETMRSRLDRRANSVIVDLATFPGGSSASWRIASGQATAGLDICAGLPEMHARDPMPLLRSRRASRQLVALDQIRSVWWRRPRAPIVDRRLAPEFASFAAANTQHSLKAAVHYLAEQGRAVNDPAKESAANYKAFQLIMAKRCGVHVPETLISHEPREMEAFCGPLWEKRAEVVFKPLAASRGAYQSTQLFTPEKRELLGSAEFCPAIFQERIIGADLRVVIVGQRVFALEERSSDPDCIDIRLDDDKQARAVELPARIRIALRRFHDALGLSFASYDLKHTPSDDYVLLEVNPSGQWLWVEEEGRFPIAEALSRLLVYGPGEEFQTRHPAWTGAQTRLLEPEPMNVSFSRAKEAASAAAT